MPDITLRNVDEGVTNALTGQAAVKGISREALIKQILERYVKQICIPSKGFMGYASNGTEIRLINAIDDVVSTTTKGPGLSQAQITALRKAELMAHPKNGSKWAGARKVLEDAGFEVYEL